MRVLLRDRRVGKVLTALQLDAIGESVMKNWDKYKNKPVCIALAAYNADFKRVGETGTFHDWLGEEVGYEKFEGGSFNEFEGKVYNTTGGVRKFRVVRDIIGDENADTEILGEFDTELEAWHFAEKTADADVMKGSTQFITFCESVTYKAADGRDKSIEVRVKGCVY